MENKAKQNKIQAYQVSKKAYEVDLGNELEISNPKDFQQGKIEIISGISWRLV